MPLKDVPELTISEEAAPPLQSQQTSLLDPKPSAAAPEPGPAVFHYQDKDHAELPHIVKFSGGLTSGMLLFTLLENEILKPERGDAVVFNNTSAEHPETYRFARRCKEECEPYGVPFFWVEFQTYEDARKGEYTRIPSYRLVNERPCSEDNPDGFSWRGEVFEELISWTGYVPNQFSRVCTRGMKLETTRQFLRDWLAGKESIPRLGHYGETSKIDVDALYRQYQMGNRSKKDDKGEVPEKIYKDKKAFALGRPHYRPEQRYGDFCSNWQPFKNEALEGKIFGGQAAFEKGAEYVAFVGLRADERHRVERVKARNLHAATGYKGEHVYMPLADMEIGRDQVNAFWNKQKWDIFIQRNGQLTNCVFCYLKGAANLKAVRNLMREVDEEEEFGSLANTPSDSLPASTTLTPKGREEFRSLKDTPSDIKWWQNLEEKYRRDLEAENRNRKNTNVQYIGFFGANTGFSYETLANSSDEEIDRAGVNVLPCDCTE